MKKLLIIILPFFFVSAEIKTALEYYYELGDRCVPKTLQSDSFEYVQRDTTFIMKRDMNNLP